MKISQYQISKYFRQGQHTVITRKYKNLMKKSILIDEKCKQKTRYKISTKINLNQIFLLQIL